MSAEDKGKNTAETAKGKAKEGVGTATGNESLKAEGQRRSGQGRPGTRPGEKIKDFFKK